MASQPVIYRVDGDIGPAITIEHRGLTATGLTITARFTKPDGTVYERTAVIDDNGPPALYHFDFQTGDLTEGDQQFDVHLSGAGIDDFSYPPRAKFILRVRSDG